MGAGHADGTTTTLRPKTLELLVLLAGQTIQQRRLIHQQLAA